MKGIKKIVLILAILTGSSMSGKSIGYSYLNPSSFSMTLTFGPYVKIVHPLITPLKAGFSFYTVQSDETLFSIAGALTGSMGNWKLLAWTNHLTDKHPLKRGDILLIPEWSEKVELLAVKSSPQTRSLTQNPKTTPPKEETSRSAPTESNEVQNLIKELTPKKWGADPFEKSAFILSYLKVTDSIVKLKDSATLRETSIPRLLTETSPVIVTSEKASTSRITPSIDVSSDFFPHLILTGVWQSNGRFKAIISNHIVSNGDAVLGVAIEEIQPEQVKVRAQTGETVILKLGRSGI